jgi:hypothetical protein
VKKVTYKTPTELKLLTEKARVETSAFIKRIKKEKTKKSG